MGPTTEATLINAIRRLIAFIALGVIMLIVGVVFYSVRLFRQPPVIAAPPPTKYISYFPFNMDAIIKLVSETTDRLEIVSDTPAYGAYSNPILYAKYHEAILKLIKDRKAVLMIVHNDTENLEATKGQIAWPPTDAGLFERYIKYHNVTTIPTSGGQFYDLLQEEPRRFKKDLGDLVLEVPFDLPVFIWLSDNKRAIFSFYNLGRQAREVSVWTEEEALVGVLHGIVETFKTKAKPTARANESK